MRILKPKQLPLFALMLVMGAFLLSGTMAYAAEGPVAEPVVEPVAEAETLSVDDVWLAGDTLHIIVTDTNTGINQELELNLRDYASAGDEYVTVQAVDRAGNISNSIQFKNPYYTPPENPPPENPPQVIGDAPPTENEPVAPDDTKPFTPDGTGAVIDNVTDGDGKEFFSISTEDGNVFYLIVDRQRNTDNVYLLNAVTEYDLMSLAKEGDGINNTIPPEPTEPPAATTAPPEPSAEPTPTPAPEQSGGVSPSLIFIIIAVAVVGVAGYYFKIVRPKQNGGNDDYDDEPEDFSDDTEVDVETGDEGSDEE